MLAVHPSSLLGFLKINVPLQIVLQEQFDSVCVSIFASIIECSPSFITACVQINVSLRIIKEQLDSIFVSIFASITKCLLAFKSMFLSKLLRSKSGACLRARAQMRKPTQGKSFLLSPLGAGQSAFRFNKNQKRSVVGS